MGETSEGTAWSGPGGRTFTGGVESLMFHGKQRVISVVQTQAGPGVRELVSTASETWLETSLAFELPGTRAGLGLEDQEHLWPDHPHRGPRDEP